MVKRYAKINSVNIVENISLIDPDIDPHDDLVDLTGVACTDGTVVNPGSTYDGTDFTSLPLDSYKRTVNFSSNGQTDVYLVMNLTGIEFNIEVDSGTSQDDAFTKINSSNAPSKPQAVAFQMAKFQNAVQVYIAGVYTDQQRQQMLNMYILAKGDILHVNRLNYLQPVLEWINSIISYAATVAVSIMGAANAIDVMAIKWNIAANVNPTPTATVVGAISISN